MERVGKTAHAMASRPLAPQTRERTREHTHTHTHICVRAEVVCVCLRYPSDVWAGYDCYAVGDAMLRQSAKMSLMSFFISVFLFTPPLPPPSSSLFLVSLPPPSPPSLLRFGVSRVRLCFEGIFFGSPASVVLFSFCWPASGTSSSPLVHSRPLTPDASCQRKRQSCCAAVVFEVNDRAS